MYVLVSVLQVGIQGLYVEEFGVQQLPHVQGFDVLDSEMVFPDTVLDVHVKRRQRRRPSSLVHGLLCFHLFLPPPTMDPELPQHPCYRNPNPTSQLKPDTTATLKYIKLWTNAIPTNYPYFLPPIEGLYGRGKEATVREYLPVPFFLFCGPGTPPTDLGTPGDVYIDLTPGAHALYCKCEEDWARWTPGGAPEALLCHPHFTSRGPEWICRRTNLQRQQAVWAAGVLESGGTAAAAESGVASRMIEGYLARASLAGGPVSASMTPSLSRGSSMDSGSSNIFASDSDAAETSDGESTHSDSNLEEASDAESTHSTDELFYPSKRARMLASSTFIGTTLAISRSSKSTPKAPRYEHPSPDAEMQHLENELAALQADADLHRLRGRKRELMALFTANRGLRLAPEVLQTLETKYRNSYPCVTAADAKAVLPELRKAVEQGRCRSSCATRGFLNNLFR
ncbi:hypothetical protein B0H12DRAFT_1157425 [Mycena haematopus]|nr:hypothetical protein B0H12DRAFT_1157425 [Mycena haematopus]